jgi:putative peptidoglycan lipid II flippase
MCGQENAESERAIATVAAATVLSRVAGLLRDSVLFALLGLSEWNGAFLFAFTVPNLFRRMLGEGALSSAMIPLFAETAKNHSQEEAFTFLNRLLSRLCAFLLLAIGAFAAIFLLGRRLLSDRWLWALGLSLFLAPYLLFTCLSAMVCGALNALGSFGLPALATLPLNGFMVAAGGCAFFLCPADGLLSTLFICGGVLAGGIGQLALPGLLLRRRGWRFHWDWSRCPLLSRLWNLFLPAVLGAAMVQINATVSRLLAFWLTADGISTLYLSSRLVELPLGIFAIAIISVVFPDLARSASSGNGEAFAHSYGHAFRSVLMVTIPAAIGLILLGRPILTILFGWGNYDADDLARTLPVLWASSLGIPFFAIAALLTRTFHARQDMKTPVRTAAIAIFANLALTVLLIKPFGAVGIALANVLSAGLQCIHLRWQMGRSWGQKFSRPGSGHALLWANGILLVFLLAFVRLPFACLPVRSGALLQLATAIPSAIVLYGLVLWRLGFAEISLLWAPLALLLRRR